jgi:hypothetical protein
MYMKKTVALLSLCFFLYSFSPRAGKNIVATRQYIEIRVYHFTTLQQLSGVDTFLKAAFLPALHQAGIGNVGVFTPIGNDTAADKKLYVLIPYKSLKQFEDLPAKLQKNKVFEQAGSVYINAAHNAGLYTRYETILLHAFEDMPEVKVPLLTGPKTSRVYELRSYESSTEKLHQNKVEMFNKGGEVGLFERLGFNAVFYGRVFSGSRMPNLMYMTSFENKAARDEHWKAFSSDPFWKTLSAKPEYKNNVSKIDIVFLTPADYSDL